MQRPEMFLKEANVKKREVFIALLIFLLFISQISFAQTPVAPELKNIGIQKSLDKIEVLLEITVPVKYESFALTNPSRIVIDLFGVGEFTCNPFVEVNDFGVKAIRTAKNRPEVIRVVFDLDESDLSYSIKETEKGISVVFLGAKAVLGEREVIKAKEETKEEVKEEAKARPEKPLPKVTPPPPPPIKEITRMEETAYEKSFSIGLAGGIYIVQEEAFKEVYGKTAPFFGGEGIFAFPLSAEDNLAVSLGVNYIFATGETTYTKEEVKLRIIPASLSLAYVRNLKGFRPFASLGVDYFSYKEILPETFAVTSVTGTAFGFNVQLGTFVRLVDSLSAKVYFKFRSAKATVEEIEVNLGGSELGVGLFYSFEF